MILAVAAFDLAVMTWRVRTNELVPDAEASGGLFKTGGNVLFGVGKAISKMCIRDSYYSWGRTWQEDYASNIQGYQQDENKMCIRDRRWISRGQASS